MYNTNFGLKTYGLEGSKWFFFSNFGGLEVDFDKDVYGAKLFGMHIGNV